MKVTISLDIQDNNGSVVLSTLERAEANPMHVGKVVDFNLTSGEKAQFMVQREEKDGWLCMLVDCLPDEYPMNEQCTNKGGYAESDLRKKLNGEILELFPDWLRQEMLPLPNGDLLRLPTEKEIFGENKYGEKEPDDVRQFEPMKKRRNRIAFRGVDEELEWYWLQNRVPDSATNFALADYGGATDGGHASGVIGVCPAFLIRKKSEPLYGADCEKS